MKKSRLKKLARYLYKVGLDIVDGKFEDKFDMTTWGELKEPGKFKNRKDLSCMTAACAIGHSGMLFKHEGFRLELNQEDGCSIIPVYQNLNNFEAVASFFDISYAEAEYLFSPDSYENLTSNDKTGPGEVADRIFQFISNTR